MRILVTGAAGSVGKVIVTYFSNLGHDLIPVDIKQEKNIIVSDLSDEKSIVHVFSQYKPEIVIHLAAIKNINLCEQDQTLSYSINYKLTEQLAEVCKKQNSQLLYFSSDYVFGKYDKFWQENDPPCPTTQYGKDKAASELLIQKILSNYAIIRTAQLYGIENDFITLVVNTLQAKTIFKAFTNLVNCPTWIHDLLTMLDKIINANHCGIFHCVGPEAMSRYTFAVNIAKHFNLDTGYIKPIMIDFSKDIRPPIVKLDGHKTYNTLKVYPNTLIQNLATYF